MARKLLAKFTKLAEHAPLLARLGFARYKIFLKVVPVVVISIGVRAILEATVDGFDGLIASTTVTPFATASMFVIALMLAGVLEDYKEAERIPANLTNVFDSLSEKIEYCALITKRKRAALDAKHKAAAAHGGDKAAHEGGGGHHHEKEEEEEEFSVIDSAAMHEELLNYLTYLLEFLASLRTEQDISAITTTYCKWLCLKLDEAAETTHVEIWEIADLFNELREDISRMAVIKRTNFIPSGYSLMQVLVYTTVVLTSLAKYDDGGPDVPEGGGGRRLLSSGGFLGDDQTSSSWFAQNISVYCNVATYCFLFVYVLTLIDDLEDPFEYTIYSLVPNLESPDGRITMHSSGSADVDVFPLLELYVRIACLAGHSDVVGDFGAVRSIYSLGAGNPLEEVPVPSALVARSDARVMDAATVSRRDHYRELLQDAMYTALVDTMKTLDQNRRTRKPLNRMNSTRNGGNSINAGGSSSKHRLLEEDE
jgi:hypothetical protein